MPIAEMLAWGSVVLSVLVLVLTVLVWRKMEGLRSEGSEPTLAELERIRALLNFQLPAEAQGTVAGPKYEQRAAVLRQAAPTSQAASAQQQFPLAEEITAFSRALGKWCDAAGDKPMGKALSARKLQLDVLVRKAMDRRNATNTVATQFERETEEIVTAVVSATDKDFADDPRCEEMDRQLRVMVDGAGLALIDPRPGTPLDRELHTSTGGTAGGAGQTRATVRAVLSRGVERPAAAPGAMPRVLTKAEVEASY